MDRAGLNFRLERNEGCWVIYYEKYLRDHFIDKALVVYLDDNDCLAQLFYNSSDYGTVYWNPQKGFSQCHSWESEEQAMGGSFLKRMFPAITHNGSESSHFAKMIENDILTALDNEPIIAYLNHLKENLAEPVDLGRLNPVRDLAD